MGWYDLNAQTPNCCQLLVDRAGQVGYWSSHAAVASRREMTSSRLFPQLTHGRRPDGYFRLF